MVRVPGPDRARQASGDGRSAARRAGRGVLRGRYPGGGRPAGRGRRHPLGDPRTHRRLGTEPALHRAEHHLRVRRPLACPTAPDAYHMIFGERVFFGYTAPPDGRWFARIPGPELSAAERAAATADEW